jgi:hypothetical protein
MRFKSFFFLILLVLLAGCAPKSPTPAPVPISAIVAATVNALPTCTAQPTYTPYPTPTPFSLSNRFCEYRFCIGHPAETPLFDVRKAENPSVYNNGMLAAYREDLFLLLVWQTSGGTEDPQFMLGLVMDDEADTRNGSMNIDLYGDITVFSIPITTTASPILPVGRAAAWICGDRAFGWKVYAPQEEIADAALQEAIAGFDCER